MNKFRIGLDSLLFLLGCIQLTVGIVFHMETLMIIGCVWQAVGVIIYKCER